MSHTTEVIQHNGHVSETVAEFQDRRERFRNLHRGPSIDQILRNAERRRIRFRNGIALGLVLAALIGIVVLLARAI